MDNKTWLWRKKSTERTSVSAEKASNGNDQLPGNVKVELENELKIVKDELSSALSECKIKEELVKKNTETAEEAIAGWERAEKEVTSLKLELGKALQQKIAAEDRSIHLDAALKECMQQLRFVREEQEHRIHDAVTRSSREFERSQLVLAEKLQETTKKVSKLSLENSHLGKALSDKEKAIRDISDKRSQAELDFNTLAVRLESVEKDNASLKYEVRVLEKELDIRNEEREFNGRTADASRRQHLESAKKIAKLESECQRLRVLVRKRLPGPAALEKMRNEVELLGKYPADARRKKLNHSALASDSSPDVSSKRISLLTEQVHTIEEENRALKDYIKKKANELQFSRNMFARTASKLSQVEKQLEESSRGQPIVERSWHSLTSQELFPASSSDVGSDDKASCAESWASALISELEHFKSGKERGTLSCKAASVSDINLMDDFVEMEKMAIVSLDVPSRFSDVSSSTSNALIGPSETGFAGNITDHHAAHSATYPRTQPKHRLTDALPGWLQSELKVLLEQYHARQRNPEHILEDIRVALEYVRNSNSSLRVHAEEILPHSLESSPCDEGFSPKPSVESSVMDACHGEADIPSSEKDKQFNSNLNNSVSKLIELLEGMSLPSQDHYAGERLPGNHHTSGESYPGYTVRVFRWKSSEVGDILQKYIRTCYDLLHEKTSLENFVQDLASAFEWIVNQSLSPQDVASARCESRKHSESESDSEVESLSNSHFGGAKKKSLTEDPSRTPPSALMNVYNGLFQMEDMQLDAREENKNFRDEMLNMELAKKDLEERLDTTIKQNESLKFELQESKKRIASLQTEVEEQVKEYKLRNEDLGMQLKVAKAELDVVHQNFTTMEVEATSRNKQCGELEARCLELQLHLESLVDNEVLEKEVEQEEKTLRADWEITAASEKLAECQETILSLGKQLKAMASPRETALFTRVISSPKDTSRATTTDSNTIPTNEKNNQRTSLLDKMLAEDNVLAEDFKYPTTIETIYTMTDEASTLLDDKIKSTPGIAAVKETKGMFPILNGTNKHSDKSVSGTTLTIVPSKKHSGGFLRKLLCRRKKGTSRKLPLPFAT